MIPLRIIGPEVKVVDDENATEIRNETKCRKS